MNTDRNHFLDVIKYATIFLVIWGHVVQQSCMLKDPNADYIFRTIYTFHMPLFMGISGYFFANSLSKLENYHQYLGDKIQQRIISLLLPMMSFGVLKIIISGTYDVMSYLKATHGIWFLGDLAINSFIVVVLLTVLKSDIYGVKWMYLAGGVIFAMLPKIGYGGNGLWMYIFFLIGMFLFVNKELRRFIFMRKCIVVSVIVYCILWVGLDIVPYEPKVFSINFLRSSVKQLIVVDILKLSLGLFGSHIFIGSMYKLYELLKGTIIERRAIKYGQYTLDIYLLNIVILEMMWGPFYRSIVTKFGVNYMHSHGLIWEIISTFIVSCLMFEFLIFVSRMMNKSSVIAKIFFYRKV